MSAPGLMDWFLKKAAGKDELFPSHVSLFMAIVYYSKSRLPNSAFRISRSELMKFSRIKSKATYHKCLSDLVVAGYLLYEPSFDPVKASTVTILCDLDSVQIV